jgi:hypothetical protein
MILDLRCTFAFSRASSKTVERRLRGLMSAFVKPGPSAEPAQRLNWRQSRHRDEVAARFEIANIGVQPRVEASPRPVRIWVWQSQALVDDLFCKSRRGGLYGAM